MSTCIDNIYKMLKQLRGELSDPIYLADARSLIDDIECEVDALAVEVEPDA